MGQFAEAYWNFGWAGIVALMVPLGIIHYYMGRYALRVVTHGEWMYFPVVLIGMKMGIGIAGSYTTEVVGTAVLVGVLHVMLMLVDGLFLAIFRQQAGDRVRRTG
jgi:hypothetical protein